MVKAIFLTASIFVGSKGFFVIAPVVFPLTLDVFISSIVNKTLINRAQKFFREQLVCLIDDIRSNGTPIVDAVRSH